MATFLAHYLKDQGAPPASEALTFRTGANEWTRARRVAAGEERHAAAPVFPGGRQARVHRAAGGEGRRRSTTYLSDPHSPVPYRPRPITLGRGWSTWQVEDQRFVHGRPDVRTYVDRSAHRAGRRLGTDQRASVCRHQRHRQRLDRQADRRLSGEVSPDETMRGYPADDRRRRDPRPVSQEHRDSPPR